MSNWAIEAEHLVKKFPRKETAKDNANSENSGDKAEQVPSAQSDPGKGSRKSAKKRSLWPFQRRNVEVSYFSAVDGVSLTIPHGEIFGLLGPNGAGKSTTIRMLCTLLEPTSGVIKVNGYDSVTQANLVRQNLGTVLAGERSIYWKLTARENLLYFASPWVNPSGLCRSNL